MTTPLGLVALLGVALVWFINGFALGLWLGERGRRQDAQRRETFGNPLAPKATTHPAAPGPEERIQDLGFSPATIKRGVDEVMKAAKQAGRPMSHEEAENQVRQMLSPDYMPADPAGIPL